MNRTHPYRSLLLSSAVAIFVFATQLFAASPQSPAAWTVSSLLYADHNATLGQLEYTREFRHTRIADFWIDRIDDPDRTILDPIQIQRFNHQTARLKQLIYPPEAFKTTYSGLWIGDKVARQFAFLASKAFYYENGEAFGNRALTNLWHQCNFDAVPEQVTARYGLVVHYAHQRLAPSSNTLLKTPDQRYFDRNQNAALDIGTPLAILHQSADKKWYFTLSPSSYGWVAAEEIALTTRKRMLDFCRSHNFLVTTQPKNALFVAGHYRDFVRMGVRLPYFGKMGGVMRTALPERARDGSLKLTAATIRTDNAHLGYLPYTPRTILTQAFAFLNAPYGWGGMFGEQDCSKFVQEIYAVTGILLPRNSADQEKAGKPLITFTGDTRTRVEELIHKGKPGSTLLHLPGHIMLYLGSYRGEPYIIHTVWGAVEGRNPLAKTAVTSVHFKRYIDKMDSAVLIEP
jgi:hypothetical protein